MAIVQRNVLCQDRECLEIHCPRTNPEWIGRLYLDPSRGYLPVRFVQQHKGAVQNEIEIEHVRNKAIGWALSGWTQKQFESPGENLNTTNGGVLECKINVNLEAALFDLEFPVGAWLIEDTQHGTRYFIKMADGSLKPISEKEYGALRRDAT